MTTTISKPSEMFRLYETAGKDGYPLEWHQTIKHAVREQAGNRCIRCQHPYQNGDHGRGEWTPCNEQCTHRGPYRFRADGWGDWTHSFPPELAAGNVVAESYQVQAAWRILTVHHLDGEKMNCRWWNLAALCQRCHLSVQGRVKMRRPYFLEHSVWFRPYAAGFYAFAILGEDLAREQTESRLDELLRLAVLAKHA